MSDTPRTDGRIAKCLDMIPDNACSEYVDLCRQLERELAAATLDLSTARTYLRECMRSLDHATQGECRRRGCWPLWCAAAGVEVVP